MRLLIVEDDPPLLKILRESLELQGFAVDTAQNGIDAEFLGDETDYDFVVLDLGLPGKNGLEILSHWRSGNRTFPVIVLTARNAWHERIEGLKAGADDYLGKPFHFEELSLRIKAVLNRRHLNDDHRITTANLVLDEARQELQVETGDQYELTATEFKLLRYLMLNPDRWHSKGRLIEHIYGQDFDKDSNVVEVYIRRLRKKTGAQHILSRRGQGYMFPSDP